MYHLSKRSVSALVGALALLAGTGFSGRAAAQVAFQVPAIVNTYRADPRLAVDIDKTANNGSIHLTAREVRQLYYESFIAGYMQGEPGAADNYAQGYRANASTAADGYTWLTRTLSARDRMPQMPVGVFTDPVTKDVHLFIALQKLPTQAACQNVLMNMVRLGLLPGDLTGTPQADKSPLATGNWRVLVHLPRGKGAPPAPTVFYPEAVGLITNATTTAQLSAWTPDSSTPLAVKQAYWEGFRARYRTWYQYVSGAYTTGANDTPNLATAASGEQEPQPFFLNFPNLIDVAEQPGGGGIDRTTNSTTNGREYVRQSGAGNQYFDAGAVWENRVLDADAGLPSGTNPTPLALGQNGTASAALGATAADVLNATQPAWHSEAQRPFEFRIHAFANGPNGGGGFKAFGFNNTESEPLAWWLHGVNTVGLSTDVGDTKAYPQPMDAVVTTQPRHGPWYDTNDAAWGGESLTGPSNLFGYTGSPVVMDFNLSNPDGVVGNGDERPVVPAGIGMVEFQFEFETYVPAANGLVTDWVDPTTGVALAAGTDSTAAGSVAKYLADNGTGYSNDGAGTRTAATNPLAGDKLTYGVQAPGGLVADGRLLDPLDPDKQQTPPGTGGNKPDAGYWRVRRYSAWPFNPAVAGLGDPGSFNYQGGPIVCRFVVSPIQVVPEDQSATSPEPDNAPLTDMARYDPADPNHYRYPQVQGIPTAGGEADVIQRACFLLGYRGDIDSAVSTTRASEDYFFPISPGASSAAHPFWVRVVQDNRPGGSAFMWTPASQCAVGSLWNSATLNSGYPLAGWLDAAFNYSKNVPARLAGRDVPRYNALKNLASPDVLPSTTNYPYRPLYNVSIFQEATQRRPDTGVAQDLYGTGNEARYNVNKLFDGDVTAEATKLPASPSAGTDGYSAGLVFRPPVVVDRVDIYTFAAITLTDWKLQWALLSDVDAATGLPRWTDVPAAAATLNLGANNRWMWSSLGVGGYVVGVRLVNVANAEKGLCELQFHTRSDVRQETLLAPRVGNQPDASIAAGAMSDAAVDVSTLTSVDVSRPDPLGTTSLSQTLQVHVPTYQPPSADAIARQALIDAGSAASYYTVTQPTDTAAGWDRYRGEGAVFLDESNSTKVMLPGALPQQAVRPASRRWDTNLYKLAYRSGAYPAATQFVSWYEEDSGRVGGFTYNPPAGGAAVNTAQLEAGNASAQHVYVAPYSTFDYEFSVAYDRRLSLAEPLVDLGKVIHGGISQWVPLTLMNVGNVPVRSVKLFIDFPLTPVAVNDSAAGSPARLAQAQPLPSWYAQDLALQSGSEDSPTESSSPGGIGVIDVATPGSPQGRSAGEVFVRAGRLDQTNPDLDRRVPIGQPIGNYTGRLRAYLDANGDNLVQTSEKSTGGVATMKLTVQESPLWRVGDFWDNDVHRTGRLGSGGSYLNLMPYNASTGVGTYQPIPYFNRMYTQPDAADATPTVAVIQDPAEMTATPPNASDSLWVGWSSLRQFGGGTNWGVYYRDAARPSFAGGSPILQTNYRSFLWPDLDAALLSNGSATERNLYPNVCVVPGSSAADKQYVLLWHNEKDTGSGRASYLQFVRWQSGSSSGILQIPDDPSGQSRINKQVPRAFVDTCTGRKVLFVGWQSGETGKTTLGFNAIWMPDSSSGAASDYKDAIFSTDTTSAFQNYPLRTPDGLTNVIDPWLLPTYRDTSSNTAGSTTALRAINVLYSAWSPLWQNQDIYWSRYKPIEEPTGSAPLTSLLNGLQLSPMAEDAYRIGAVAPYPGLNPAGPGYYVKTAPGGRLPFPRVTDELLLTNENHTVYAAGAADWIMPAPNFRLSQQNGTGWVVGKAVHRGFADKTKPLFDQDRYASLAAGTANARLDPLVVLRVYQAPTLNGSPLSTTSSNWTYANAPVVTFDLDNAQWDSSAGEWVLPVTGPALLTAQGVSVVRIHPGLGRVTFDHPLYRRGTTNPIYVYATYRPCAWRVTTSPAPDSQPTAAFDSWERMAIVWRRSTAGGKGQLWYRTFSLVVPLNKAPVTQLNAVVNDGEDDGVFDGAPAAKAAISHWTFTGLSGGLQQEGTGPWSDVAGTTSQNYTVTKFGSANVTSAAQSDVWAGRQGAAMVNFGYDDIGKRVRFWYTTPLSGYAGTFEEAQVVPGFGPERLVPLDGPVNESQPAVAAESYYVGYNYLNQAAATISDQIMSTRFWLAWVSARDLYQQTDPPARGRAGAHIYYGTFMPDFGAGGTAP